VTVTVTMTFSIAERAASDYGKASPELTLRHDSDSDSDSDSGSDSMDSDSIDSDCKLLLEIKNQWKRQENTNKVIQ
jgi:hypothetical protein